MAFPTLDSDTYNALHALANQDDSLMDENSDTVIIHVPWQHNGLLVTGQQIQTLEELGLIELQATTSKDAAPYTVTERGYYQLRKQAKKQPRTIRIHGLGR